MKAELPKPQVTNFSALLKQPLIRVGLVGLSVALIAIVTVGVLAVTEPKAPLKPSAGASMPNNPAIEEKWGIRVSQIGVAADGGLIDFRFVVLDSEKALKMMTDEKNLPVLVSEDGGGVVNSAALMPSKHALNPGQTYFLLYRNTKNAVKHDSTVSVIFSNDLKMEHAIVK